MEIGLKLEASEGARPFLEMFDLWRENCPFRRAVSSAMDLSSSLLNTRSTNTSISEGIYSIFAIWAGLCLSRESRCWTCSDCSAHFPSVFRSVELANPFPFPLPTIPHYSDAVVRLQWKASLESVSSTTDRLKEVRIDRCSKRMVGWECGGETVPSLERMVGWECCCLVVCEKTARG